jgi:hypothetical protein
MDCEGSECSDAPSPRRLSDLSIREKLFLEKLFLSCCYEVFGDMATGPARHVGSKFFPYIGFKKGSSGLCCETGHPKNTVAKNVFCLPLYAIRTAYNVACCPLRIGKTYREFGEELSRGE